MFKRIKIAGISLVSIVFVVFSSGCSSNAPTSSKTLSESNSISSATSSESVSSTSEQASSTVESVIEDLGVDSPTKVLYKDEIIEYGMSKAQIDNLLGAGDERVSDQAPSFMMVYYGDDFAVVYSKRSNNDYIGGSLRQYSEATVGYMGIRPGDSESVIKEKFEEVKAEDDKYYVYFENGKNVSPYSYDSDIKISYTIEDGLIKEISIGISEAQARGLINLG